MKIGLLLDDSLDKTDGVQQFVLSVGKWLSAQGNEVHYIASNTVRQDLPNVHSLVNNVNVKFNQNRLSIPKWTSASAIKQVTDLDLDVLHVQLPYSPMMGGRVLAALPARTARVGTFHIMPSGWASMLGTSILGKVQKSTLSKFDSCTASSVPAREFAKRYGLQTEVVANPVDLSAMQPKNKVVRGSVPTIVFLGRLVERKGCGLLLKAALQLKKDHPELNFKLIVGGKGPLNDKLKAFVAANKLQEVVQFAGFIDEAQKPAFLAAADIAVFPATTGESFGIVLIEAMVAGAGVVLAGDNPGYCSVMEHDSQVIVAPRETRLFAERLYGLLTDVSMRQAIHDRQQELVKKYDVNVVGNQLMQVYQSAIAKRLKKGA